MKNKKLYNIFLYSTIYLIMLLICILLTKRNLVDGDLFFDLKTGESLLKYGLDFKDHFSFIPNLTYMYPHFLYYYMVYFVHKLFGFGGLYIFYLYFYFLIGVIIFNISQKYSHNKFISLIVSLITIYLCRAFIITRVQTLTYVLLLLDVCFLETLYKTGKKKYSFFLIIISILICNIHMPIWLFTIILTLPFLAEILIKFLWEKISFLKKYSSKKITLEYPKNIKLFLITVLLLLFCGLISPFKLLPYTYFLKSLGNSSLLFITEMNRTILINRVEFLILLIIFAILAIILNSKIKLRDLCLIGGLFVFGLIANRNVVFVYLFFPLLFVKIYFENFEIPQINLGKNTNNKLFNFIKNIFRQINYNIILLTLVILLIISTFKLLNVKVIEYYSKQIFPIEITKYLKENTDYKNIHLYTHYNYGSYMLYNDIPVFIDSRAEVYTKEFNGGYDIIEDYQNSFNYKDYKQIFKKYYINYALVYYDTRLYYYLKNDASFEELYNENNDFALFKCNL